MKKIKALRELSARQETWLNIIMALVLFICVASLLYDTHGGLARSDNPAGHVVNGNIAIGANDQESAVKLPTATPKIEKYFTKLTFRDMSNTAVHDGIEMMICYADDPMKELQVNGDGAYILEKDVDYLVLLRIPVDRRKAEKTHCVIAASYTDKFSSDYGGYVTAALDAGFWKTDSERASGTTAIQCYVDHADRVKMCSGRKDADSLFASGPLMYDNFFCFPVYMTDSPSDLGAIEDVMDSDMRVIDYSIYSETQILESMYAQPGGSRERPEYIML